MSPNQEPKKARARKSAPPKSAPRRKRERWRGARHLQPQPQPASQPGARARPPAHPPAASAAGLREAGREARECTATLSRGLLGCFGWGAGAGARFFDGTYAWRPGRPVPVGTRARGQPGLPFFYCAGFCEIWGVKQLGKKTAEKCGLGGCAGASSARAGAAGRGGEHVAHHRGAPHRARASSPSFPHPTPAGARLSTGSGLRGARVAGADHSPGRAGRHRGRLAAQLGLTRTRAASDGRGK